MTVKQAGTPGAGGPPCVCVRISCVCLCVHVRVLSRFNEIHSIRKDTSPLHRSVCTVVVCVCVCVCDAKHFHQAHSVRRHSNHSTPLSALQRCLVFCLLRPFPPLNMTRR